MLIGRSLKLLERARADTEGAVAVEFALLITPLILLMFAIVELAWYFFLSAALEGAVLHASRYGATNQEDASLTREEAIEKIISDNTWGYVDTKADTFSITTLVYDNFEDIGQAEPYTDANLNEQYDAGEDYSDVNGNGQWDEDTGAVGLGGANEIVLYQVKFTRKTLTGVLDPVMKLVEHEATVALRNEP